MEKLVFPSNFGQINADIVSEHNGRNTKQIFELAKYFEILAETHFFIRFAVS